MKCLRPHSVPAVRRAKVTNSANTSTLRGLSQCRLPEAWDFEAGTKQGWWELLPGSRAMTEIVPLRPTVTASRCRGPCCLEITIVVIIVSRKNRSAHRTGGIHKRPQQLGSEGGGGEEEEMGAQWSGASSSRRHSHSPPPSFVLMKKGGGGGGGGHIMVSSPGGWSRLLAAATTSKPCNWHSAKWGGVECGRELLNVSHSHDRRWWQWKS